MRILIKGGVWKNTEDEILKAAVMKYGKNQWSRVASLMNRKSAKQCKARWYEWLDPSIKKTEWTREEEEKLLHLAKLMPNQWRTIAPMVGRTAGQCIEHYEHLLDQAQGETEENEDARKLRPGEIDPAPETKPARPDPIDMDEDEMEMLAEARARLANTKGKKAKRKARERMLDESRRLATLQKRRELKAAGIESKLGGGKKRKFIDYAKEIPFQKVVPAGFYDISEENTSAKSMHLDAKAYGLELSKLEGRHAKDEEERARKRDSSIMKKMYEENAPLAVLKSAADDPTALRRRAPLMLPAPQVSEGELEDILKLNRAMPPPEGLPARFSATGALVADYTSSGVMGPTPMRTPATEDIIMQEARNQLILREMTPLSTQNLPELFEGTGFTGATPRRAVASTPSMLGQFTPAVASTPARSTSSVAGSVASYRDQFGLNDSFGGSVASVTPSGVLSLSHSKTLRSAFQSLPEPEYTYEVSVPMVEDVDEEAEARPEDMAEVEERNRAAAQAAHDLAMARRSAVLKRGLPRPLQVDPLLARPSTTSFAQDMQAASALINEEMVALALFELKMYPPEGVKASALSAAYSVDLEAMDLKALSIAHELIEDEMRSLPDLKQQLNKLVDELEEAHNSLLFTPGKATGDGMWKAPTSKAESLAALKGQFRAAQGKFDKDKKRVDKLETKFNVLTQGYRAKEKMLRVSLQDVIGQYNQACADLDGLTVVRDQEARAAEYRIQQLKAEAQAVQEAELIGQTKFAKLAEYARECGLSV